MGYLEALWHFAGRYTPQGDIGKYSDAEIEAWIEWRGEAGKLINSILLAGWLDSCNTHRLLVHHWHDHADDATKLALKRKSLIFVTRCPDSVPTVLGLPVPVPVPVPVPEPDTHNAADAAMSVRLEEDFQLISENKSRNTSDSATSKLRIEFEKEFWPHAWMKKGKGAAWKAYRQARRGATCRRSPTPQKRLGL